MVGPERRSTSAGFKFQTHSLPLFKFSSQSGNTKAAPFRPRRRPRSSFARPSPAVTLIGTSMSSKTCQDVRAVAHASKADGAPHALATGSAATSGPTGSRSLISDVRSARVRVPSAIPLPSTSPSNVQNKPLFPGKLSPATCAQAEVTLRFLTAVGKVLGRRPALYLPPSVRAEIEFVSDVEKQIEKAFQNPVSDDALKTACKALDALTQQLKDMRQGLTDSSVLKESVDSLLVILSSSKCLARIVKILATALCGHHENAAGVRAYGRRIIQSFFLALTALHNENVNRSSVKMGDHRDGFLVYYLYNNRDLGRCDCNAQLQTELDMLDKELVKLREMKCVDEDKVLVTRLGNRLAASSTGLLVRPSASGRVVKNPRARVLSPTAVDEFSRPCSPASRGIGTLRPKDDLVGWLALPEASSGADDRTYRRGFRQLEQSPMVTRIVCSYQELRKRVYVPNPTIQKSIYRGRRRTSSARRSRLSFSSDVAAVEIEHHADRSSYEGHDPLRPINQEHEDIVELRSAHLSRRALLDLAMVTERNVSNLQRTASGSAAENPRYYRIQPPNHPSALHRLRGPS